MSLGESANIFPKSGEKPFFLSPYLRIEMACYIIPYNVTTISEGGPNESCVLGLQTSCESIDRVCYMFNFRNDPQEYSLRLKSATTRGFRVWLRISATDSYAGLKEMCFSKDGPVYSAWENYSTLKNWTLSSGDEDKTVYLKMRDGAGNEARPVSTAILYEPATSPNYSMVAPSVILIVILAVCVIIVIRRFKAGRDDMSILHPVVLPCIPELLQDSGKTTVPH